MFRLPINRSDKWDYHSLIYKWFNPFELILYSLDKFHRNINFLLVIPTMSYYSIRYDNFILDIGIETDDLKASLNWLLDCLLLISYLLFFLLFLLFGGSCRFFNVFHLFLCFLGNHNLLFGRSWQSFIFHHLLQCFLNGHSISFVSILFHQIT